LFVYLSTDRVGECRVGRHASGGAVERCVGLGVGRVGSVGLPVFSVVGRWIGHCFLHEFVVFVCAPTHDDPPSSFLGGRRERGIQFPSTKASTLPKHMAPRQGRHKGAGKGTSTSCFEGGGSISHQRAGAFPHPHPFRGREVCIMYLASTYRQSGAKWAPPDNLHSHNRTASILILILKILAIILIGCCGCGARTHMRTSCDHVMYVIHDTCDVLVTR